MVDPTVFIATRFFRETYAIGPQAGYKIIFTPLRALQVDVVHHAICLRPQSILGMGMGCRRACAWTISSQFPKQAGHRNDDAILKRDGWGSSHPDWTEICHMPSVKLRALTRWWKSPSAAFSHCSEAQHTEVYTSLLRSLRPCWMAFLSLLWLLSHLCGT